MWNSHRKGHKAVVGPTQLLHSCCKVVLGDHHYQKAPQGLEGFWMQVWSNPFGWNFRESIIYR